MTPRHAWMTKGLMKSCVKKSKLYKIYCKEKTNEHKNRYVTYRNKLKLVLRAAEKRFYSDLLLKAKGNMRQTWKVIGSVLNQSKLSKISKSFNIDGSTVSNTFDIAEKFNEYFTNIGCNLAANIPNTLKSFKDYLPERSSCNSLFFSPCTYIEIMNIVNNLESKTSYGFDGIPVNILKATIVYIAEPMSRLINCSSSSGVVPSSLKIGRICPVYKDGDKDSFSNYRPISVLSSFSKIYEKVVLIRLRSYLAANNILNSVQYGFQQNHSTYMAILDMYDRITSAVDRNEFSIGLFIDLSNDPSMIVDVSPLCDLLNFSN